MKNSTYLDTFQSSKFSTPVHHLNPKKTLGLATAPSGPFGGIAYSRQRDLPKGLPGHASTAINDSCAESPTRSGLDLAFRAFSRKKRLSMAEAFPDVRLHAIPSVLSPHDHQLPFFLHGVRQGARDAEQDARDSPTSYQHTPLPLRLCYAAHGPIIIWPC